MERKRLLKKLCIVSLTLTLLAFTLATPFPASATQTPPKPEMISTSGYGVGGAAYAVFAAVGEGMLKKFGIRFRQSPVATGVSRLLAARVGQTDVAGTSLDTFFAIEGLYDFADFAWGPQPIRITYQCVKVDPYAMATRGDSGIKTFADLKGRKVPKILASPNSDLMVQASLAWAGLTYDDVTVVETTSYPSGTLKALLDGTIDIAPMAGGASYAHQLASGPHGLHWIPMPIENKEGWKKWLKLCPTYFPQKCTIGAGLSKDNPQPLTSYIWPVFGCYPDRINEDKAYWITKAIWESYPLYKDISELMPAWNLEQALKQPCWYPWHEGSIKYLKEIGLWTDRHERNQKKMLERWAALRGLWDDVVAEAAEKGIHHKKFPEYWLKKRAEKFPGFWQPMD